MTDRDDPIVQTTGLSIGYSGPGRRMIASSLEMSLRAGRMVCILGPNGCGKTTLLRTIAGLLPALDGEVLFRGRSIRSLSRSEMARERSVVLTRHAGVGMLRVREVVSLGRLPYADWLGRLGTGDMDSAERAMETTGCVELADRRMSELSDGERQRAFIARAMAQETPCMLLDEPTAFLDLPRRVEIVRLLLKLARSCRRAIALSTHDLDLALQTADEIWLLARDGRVFVGLPEELVLDGSFGQVFGTEGVQFDRASGRFVWPEGNGDRVRVLGEGLEAFWTAHALRRMGFRVAGAGDEMDCTVEAGPGAVWRHWRGATPGSEGEAREFASLGGLLEAIGTGDRGSDLGTSAIV